MTGSIQEKHGKLYAVLCYKDVLGKPQRKGVPTNLEVRGNKKRAESMLPGSSRNIFTWNRMSANRCCLWIISGNG